MYAEICSFETRTALFYNSTINPYFSFIFSKINLNEEYLEDFQTKIKGLKNLMNEINEFKVNFVYFFVHCKRLFFLDSKF